MLVDGGHAAVKVKPAYWTENILFSRFTQLGVLLVGGIASGYVIYNHNSFLLSIAKDLFQRTVSAGGEVLFRGLSILQSIGNELWKYIDLLTFKLSGGVKLNEVWIKVGGVEISVGEFLFSVAQYLLVVCVIKVLVKILKCLKSLIYKIDIDNTILSSSSTSKLPRKILKQIAAKEPWEVYQIIKKKSSNFSNMKLEDILKLAKYAEPENLASIIKEYPEIQDSILYYCSKDPDLYCGADRLSTELFKHILASAHREFIFDCLCANPNLWKGPEKIASEILSKTFFKPTVSIDEILFFKEWVSLFKNSRSDTEELFNFVSNSRYETFDKAWPQFISKKIIKTCTTNLLNQYAIDQVGPIINYEMFFADPTISQWNMPSPYAIEITESDWGIIKEIRLTRILQSIYLKFPIDLKINIKNFCDNCLKTNDVLENPSEKQKIKNRVAVVINFIESCTASTLPKKVDKHQLIAKAQLILDVLNNGGKNCPDGSLAALTVAENLIKMISNPEYAMNVIVHRFKHMLIQEIDKSKEGAETYLYYLLKFNTILQLDIPFRTMSNERVAKKEPLGQLLQKLITACTPENLINFAAHSIEFRLMFPIDDIEIQNKIQKLKQLIDDVYDLETNTIAQIQNAGIKLEESEINQIRNNPKDVDPRSLVGKLNYKQAYLENEFYVKKAQTLFFKAGFFIEASRSPLKF